MLIPSTLATVHSRPPLCHLDRSAAQRSAVQRSLLGNVFRPSEGERRRRLVTVLDAVIEASPVCRLVGLNSKQIGKNAALLRRELCLKLA
jgi:hypothetical protein